MFVFIKAPFSLFHLFHVAPPPPLPLLLDRLGSLCSGKAAVMGVDNRGISLLSEKLSLCLLAGGWMNGGTWMEGNKQFCAVLLWLGL